MYILWKSSKIYYGQYLHLKRIVDGHILLTAWNFPHKGLPLNPNSSWSGTSTRHPHSTLMSWLRNVCHVMAHFHQRRRRRIPKRIPNPIDTLYYAQLFPLVRRWRQRWRRRLFLMVTVPILGTDLCPRDRSPSQFYYILIRGLESVSVPVEKPA